MNYCDCYEWLFISFNEELFVIIYLECIRKYLPFFILCRRYGIRVDPRQWFLFLSGKNDGGEEYPSLLLICCKWNCRYVILHSLNENGTVNIRGPDYKVIDIYCKKLSSAPLYWYQRKYVNARIIDNVSIIWRFEVIFFH